MRKKYLVAQCIPYSLQFKFFIQDGIGKDIFYKWGVYSEDHISKHILENIGIQDGDLILDIGANIGWYSLVLSSKAAPTVIAFEPDPQNFALFTENIAINHKKNIQAFSYAVSNIAGITKLHLYKSHNLGRHSLIPHAKSKSFVEVKTVILDDFLSAHGLAGCPIKLIKIDIEGFEFTALRGAKASLMQTRFVLCEFSPAIMEQMNESPLDFIRFMNDMGFSASEFDEGMLRPANFGAMLAHKEEINDILWERK